jgi:hypothetical protein
MGIYGDFGFRWGCALRSASLPGDFDTAVGTIFKQGAVDIGDVSQRSDGVGSA